MYFFWTIQTLNQPIPQTLPRQVLQYSNENLIRNFLQLYHISVENVTETKQIDFIFGDNNTRNNDDNNYDNIQVYHGNGAFNIRFTPAFHFRLYFGTMEKRPKNCIVDRVSMALEISCHTSQHKQFASGEDKSWFSL